MEAIKRRSIFFAAVLSVAAMTGTATPLAGCGDDSVPQSEGDEDGEAGELEECGKGIFEGDFEATTDEELEGLRDYAHDLDRCLGSVELLPLRWAEHRPG